MPVIICLALGAITLAISLIFIEGIFLTYISPPTISLKECQTKLTPCSKEIIKRVILSSVMGRTPLSLIDKKNGITEPREPITLP